MASDEFLDGRTVYGADCNAEPRKLASILLRRSAAPVPGERDIRRYLAIAENNRGYRSRGDTRFAAGNAPATEAHFTIWSSKTSVVLSILDTAIGCSPHFFDRTAHAQVKLCPLRIAEFEDATVKIREGGRICFLELDRSVPNARIDEASSVSYASYDVESKTIKTGMIVGHTVVDGCSNSIPLRPK